MMTLRGLKKLVNETPEGNLDRVVLLGRETPDGNQVYSHVSGMALTFQNNDTDILAGNQAAAVIFADDE